MHILHPLTDLPPINNGVEKGTSYTWPLIKYNLDVVMAALGIFHTVYLQKHSQACVAVNYQA